MNPRSLTRLCFILLLPMLASPAFTQTTAFTYQGQLTDNGAPATGDYDLRFALCNAATAGSVVGGPLTNSSVAVANGLFTATLDFGPSAFTNANHWLEIGVRTNGSTNAYVILSPRQQITPNPYAIKVMADGLLPGTYGGAAAFTNDANIFTGTFFGNGSGLQLRQGPAGATTWNIRVANISGGEGETFPDSLVFSTGQGTRAAMNTAGDLHAYGEISSSTHLSAIGNVYADGNMYATSFIISSDRNLKEDAAPADVRELLDRVLQLPIASWRFKSDPATRHIGPMAQDFYAAFKVGADAQHIATVDADGVALAAIQGLNQKLEQQLRARDAEIQGLRQTLAELKRLVEALARQQNGEQP